MIPEISSSLFYYNIRVLPVSAFFKMDHKAIKQILPIKWASRHQERNSIECEVFCDKNNPFEGYSLKLYYDVIRKHVMAFDFFVHKKSKHKYKSLFSPIKRTF